MYRRSFDHGFYDLYNPGPPNYQQKQWTPYCPYSLIRDIGPLYLGTYGGLGLSLCIYFSPSLSKRQAGKMDNDDLRVSSELAERMEASGRLHGILSYPLLYQPERAPLKGLGVPFWLT